MSAQAATTKACGYGQRISSEQHTAGQAWQAHLHRRLLHTGAAAQAQRAQAAKVPQAAAPDAVAAHQLQVLQRRGRAHRLPLPLQQAFLILLWRAAVLQRLRAGWQGPSLRQPRGSSTLTAASNLLTAAPELLVCRACRGIQLNARLLCCSSSCCCQQVQQGCISQGGAARQLQPHEAAPVGGQHRPQPCIGEEGAARDAQAGQAAQACDRVNRAGAVGQWSMHGQSRRSSKLQSDSAVSPVRCRAGLA